MGKEATYDVAVPSTRKVYWETPAFTKARAPRDYAFATGTRDNRRAMTLGAVEVAGSAEMPLSGDEIIEWCLAGIQGGVVPTSPGATAKLWTFKPGLVLDSMCVEMNDGARNWRATGVRVNKLNISGNVHDQVKIKADLFGTRLDPLAALTTGLTDRVPTFMEGWEARLYIEALGGTPGLTNIPGTLVNYSIDVDNKLDRKYFGDNRVSAGATTIGEIDIMASILFEASVSAALAEYLNWDGQVPRLVRLEFGQNAIIDAGTNEAQTISITGGPTGGTFMLSFGGYTTYPIPYNTTAAQLQAALEGIPSIGYGAVTCTGGSLPTLAVVATFAGTLGGQVLAAMTAAASLTGGATPAVVVTRSTPGVAAYRRFVTFDIPGAWASVKLDSSDNNTRGYEMQLHYLYDPTLAAGLQIRCQNSRAAAW